mmetsp:Transcript_56194/g.162869  ORF Transcript_56194/g.162869 Transcript_56194/m.162869 type:complete len:803 (-) Transcript_56194:266-2674(-)
MIQIEALGLIPVLSTGSAAEDDSTMSLLEEQSRKIIAKPVDEFPAPDAAQWASLAGCWTGSATTDGGIAFSGSAPGDYTMVPENCCTPDSDPLRSNITVSLFRTPAGFPAFEFGHTTDRYYVRSNLESLDTEHLMPGKSPISDRIFDMMPYSPVDNPTLTTRRVGAIRNFTAQPGYFDAAMSMTDERWSNENLTGLATMLMSGFPSATWTSLQCFYLKLSQDGKNLTIISTVFKTLLNIGDQDLKFDADIYMCPPEYGSWDTPAAQPQDQACVVGCRMPKEFPDMTEDGRISKVFTLTRAPTETCFADVPADTTGVPGEFLGSGVVLGEAALPGISISDVGANVQGTGSTTTQPMVATEAEAPDDVDVDSGGSNIVGLAVGLIVGVLCIGCILRVAWLVRRKRRAKAKGKHPDLTNHDGTQIDISMQEHTLVSDMMLENEGIGELVEKGAAEHWLLPWKSFQADSGVVGVGTFGTVQRGTLFGSTSIALKLARQPDDMPMEEFAEKFKSFMTEARTYGCIRHPNLVLFHGVTVQDVGDRYFGIALEWVDGEDMATYTSRRHSSGEYIRDTGLGKKGEVEVLKETKIAHDITKAMLYLHSQETPIAHNGLKPTNILIEISDPPLAKVTDIRQDPLASSSDLPEEFAIAARRYMAPEILGGAGSDHRGDMFSFGCLVHFMLTAKAPPDSKDGSAVRQALATIVAKSTDDAELVLASVGEQCVVLDPGARPDFANIFQTLDSGEASTAPASSAQGSSRGSPIRASEDPKNNSQSPPVSGATPEDLTSGHHQDNEASVALAPGNRV